MKVDKLQWSRVTRQEVERAARFPSIAAVKILAASTVYNDPVFYSLHIGSFAVIEKKDAHSIFSFHSKETRARQAKRRSTFWANKSDAAIKRPEGK